MNIFWFNTSDLTDCARCHPDKLLIKMATEHTQLLAQALLYYDKSATVPKKDGSSYKSTHANHPCAVWARHNRQNFVLLCNLTLELCKEYEKRFGKPSSFFLPVKEALRQSYVIPEPEIGYIQNYPVAINEFWLTCMGYEKAKTQLVDADLAQILYREYLRLAKCHYSYWKNTSPPIWWHRQEGNGRMFCSIKFNHKTEVFLDSNDNHSQQDRRVIFDEIWKVNCEESKRNKVTKIQKSKLLKIALANDFNKEFLLDYVFSNIKSKITVVEIPEDLEEKVVLCNGNVKNLRALIKTIINKKIPTNKTLELWVEKGNEFEKIKNHLENQ